MIKTITKNKVDASGCLQYVEGLLDKISREDINSSATLCAFKANAGLAKKVLGVLNDILPQTRERMLDLGCGYGGHARLISDMLNFKEIHGVDIDDNKLSISKEKDIQIYKCNLDGDSLPFPNEHFDLVTSFGVLEHLTCFDNLIREAYRVLKDQGCFLISAPNLGSWINRITLLFGYQPRNLEISKLKVVGVHGFYQKFYDGEIKPDRHINSCTLRALKELVEYYGFRIVRCWGAGIVPSPDLKLNPMVRVFDAFLSRRSSFSVRFFVLTQK